MWYICCITWSTGHYNQSWVSLVADDGLGPILLTWFNPAWISNYMPRKGWDEITHSFPNFNGCTVEVWEWFSNFTPHFIMDLIKAGIKIKPCQLKGPLVYISLSGHLQIWWWYRVVTSCHINGLVQERHNSIANTLELCLSCTNSSICTLVWWHK